VHVVLKGIFFPEEPRQILRAQEEDGLSNREHFVPKGMHITILPEAVILQVNKFFLSANNELAGRVLILYWSHSSI